MENQIAFLNFLNELGSNDVICSKSIIHGTIDIPSLVRLRVSLWINIEPVEKWFTVNLMVFDNFIPLFTHCNFDNFDDFKRTFHKSIQIKSILDFMEDHK